VALSCGGKDGMSLMNNATSAGAVGTVVVVVEVESKGRGAVEGVMNRM